LNVDQMIRDFI